MKRPKIESFKEWKAWSKTQISLKSYDLTFKYKDGYIDFSANIITFYSNPKERYKWHRLDGPALIDSQGVVGYWIDDVQYKEEDYWKHPLVIENKMLEIIEEVLNE